VRTGVDYALGQGFPSKQLILGVPTYAWYFPTATGPGQPSDYDAGQIDYRDLPDLWVTNAFETRRAWRLRT
jgi:chitinase